MCGVGIWRLSEVYGHSLWWGHEWETEAPIIDS